jgi:hypothetical protein
MREDFEIGVPTWVDGKVVSRSVSEEGGVFPDLDVDKGHGGGVWGGVGDVDHRSEGEGGLGCVFYAEVDELGLEGIGQVRHWRMWTRVVRIGGRARCCEEILS